MRYYHHQRQVLIFFFMGLLILFNYPILLIFNRPTAQGFSLYAYILTVWLIAIVGLWCLLSYSKWFKE